MSALPNPALILGLTAGLLAACLSVGAAQAQSAGGGHGSASGTGATTGGVSATGKAATTGSVATISVSIGSVTSGGPTTVGGATSGGTSTTSNGTVSAPASAGHGLGLQIVASSPSSACGGLKLEPPPPDVSAERAVAALSEATQAYIRECACDSQQCIADALDQYSKALAVVAPRLPPPLRNLPKIVAEAAHRVRVARTKAEATRALEQAIATVHKDISLVRSEDVETQTSKRRSGELVADTLSVASAALVNSGGL